MSLVVAVRDDGSFEGETLEELAGAGLTAKAHPSMAGWLLIDTEGMHGSDPEDVDFELFMHSFATRIQEDGHEWRDPGDVLDPAQCGVEDCGLELRDHVTASPNTREEPTDG